MKLIIAICAYSRYNLRKFVDFVDKLLRKLKETLSICAELEKYFVKFAFDFNLFPLYSDL